MVEKILQFLSSLVLISLLLHCLRLTFSVSFYQTNTYNMIFKNEILYRNELKINLHSDVLRLIFNKFKEMFSSREELWLNLPSDALRLIFKKLEKKRVFAQICRSWHLIADDEIFWLLRSSGPKSILLLLPRQSTAYIAKLSYDMFSSEKDGKIEKKPLSFTPSQIKIIGSCRGGWTLILETNTNDLKLWNLLFDVKIHLPYFPFFPSYVIKAATFFDYNFGIGVAIIYGDGKLAFVKYGDFKWSYLCGFEAKEGQYEDLISSKDWILALSKNGESIHAWNFEGKNILNVKLDFPQDMEETKEPEKYRHKLYIVESKGRVFLVIRWLLHCGYFISEFYHTVNFYVYIFDEEKRGWSRVESLGDEAIFIGKNQTMLLQAKDFEKYQKNSIYYAGYSHERLSLEEVPEEEWKNSNSVTVFCLEDSSIKRYRHEFVDSLFSCWIISGV